MYTYSFTQIVFVIYRTASDRYTLFCNFVFISVACISSGCSKSKDLSLRDFHAHFFNCLYNDVQTLASLIKICIPDPRCNTRDVFFKQIFANESLSFCPYFSTAQMEHCN
jgi:hypothetical protein